MKKKLLALLLATTMVATLFAGCGGNEEGGNSEQVNGSENGGDVQEDPDEIVIALMSLAPMDTALSDHVEEELNKMFLEKINVKADIQWYDGGTYGQTVPMMLNGGDQVDLIMCTPVPSAGYASYMAAGQLMDIAPYLEEYGPAILDTMGDYLGATSIGDKVYAVGNMTSLYAYQAINMNADVLKQLGLYDKAAAIKTWDDYEAILEEVVAKTDLAGVGNSDAEGSIITTQPFMTGNGAFADVYFVDTIGDGYQYTYVDPATDKVKCYFECEDWYKGVQEVTEWYKKGLVYKDAAVSEEYAAALIKNGVVFSYLASAELGGASNVAANAGCEILEIVVANKEVGTASFQKFGFAVPVNSEYPEAAVKVLNLLYSDQDVVDTLAWGVKGVDWEVNADGMGVYPEGKDVASAYHTADFLYGNRLMITPWEGQATDIREQQIETNKQAPASKYIGCAVDTSVVATEIAAVKAVVDQYKPMLSSGACTDVEGTYEDFIDALYAAGMQTILDEFQSQLDAWLANK